MKRCVSHLPLEEIRKIEAERKDERWNSLYAVLSMIALAIIIAYFIH
jgi:preprotein translocase subunit SecE